jgi:hypothetical protein
MGRAIEQPEGIGLATQVIVGELHVEPGAQEGDDTQQTNDAMKPLHGCSLLDATYH